VTSGWALCVVALVGRGVPSRDDPLATFTKAWDVVHVGGSRFASVVLPFDPVAEPGLHGLLLAAAAVWFAALALVWLVAARPLPTVLLGVLPFAVSSTEFPLPHPAVRLALLVGLLALALAAGRRARASSIVVVVAPLVLVALVAGSVPGLARASILDWRTWGTSGTSSDRAATDVRFAWDQSYDGLHYTGEPTVVLHVHSPRPSYWRVTVLDSFDGLRFGERDPSAMTAAAGAEARVEPPPTGQRTDVQIEVDGLDEPYLVGAGVPVSFQVPESTGGGTIDANGVVRVLRPPTRGTRYHVSAVIADPSRASLRDPRSTASEPPGDGGDATPFDGAPALPAFGTPGRAAAVSAVLALHPAWRGAYAWAEKATAGAGTPYDVAFALERKLRAGHAYDGASTLPAGQPDALANWVVSGAPGYCQMFSASMAELLRLLGVPSRIVEGFVTGAYDPASKSYIVDDRDAHAWVEAWLPAAGWVPFDPTPGRYLPTRASSSSDLVAAAKQQAAARAKARAQTPSTPSTGSRSITHRASTLASGGSARRVVELAAALVILVAALVGGRRAGRWRARSGGPRAEVRTSRTRLSARARRRGVVLGVGVTNGELAAALERGFDVDAAGWADAADRAAYAPLEDAEDSLETLRSETRRLQKALR
jgi:transglutaminase-like putative cysteine protease